MGSVAIETGTCRGNGTRLLAKKFRRVITIELSAPLSRQARERLSSPEFSHVEFRTGNSGDELTRLLPGLTSTDTLFFFLDAHWSGDSSVDWEKSKWQGYGLDTAHLGRGELPTGPEQCPLADELTAIAQHWRGKAYVLIDDTKNIPESGPGLRNNGFPGEDWSHLSRELLMQIVKERLVKAVYLENPHQLFLELAPLT